MRKGAKYVKVKGHANLYKSREGNFSIRLSWENEDRWIATGCTTIQALRASRVWRDFQNLSRADFMALARSQRVSQERSLNNLIAPYLTYCEGRGIRETVQKRTHLNRLAAHTHREQGREARVGDMTIADIDAEVLDGFRAALATSTIHGKKKSKKIMAGSTVNRYLDDASAFFKWAMRPPRRYVQLNPLSLIERYTENPKVVPPPDDAEYARLLAAAAGWFRRVIEFASEEGARLRAITELKRCDVQRGGVNGFVTLIRKGGGDYTIPLTPRAAALLKEIPLRLDTPFVFCDFDGEPLWRDNHRGHDYNYLYDEWKATLKRAGLRHFRFHDLRARFGTEKAKDDVEKFKIQKLLGHKTDKATARYVRLAAKDLEGAMSGQRKREERKENE